MPAASKLTQKCFFHLRRRPDLTIATRLCLAAIGLSFVAYSPYRTPQLGWYWTFPSLGESLQPCVISYTGYMCASVSRSRSVCSSATVSTAQHRYINRRSAIQSAQMYIDRDFALLTTVTWSCRAPTLADSVGVVILCPGRTSGTSCHLTFGKCPINQNNLLEHWKLFLFPNSTGKHFWG